MVGLVDDAFLLLFPGSIRSPQCAQRVMATRSRLLVCLPYHTEPHQEALSRTNRDGDHCALRESGSGAQQFAFACLSYSGVGCAVVGAKRGAALHQALSSSSAELIGRPLSLAQR